MATPARRHRKFRGSPEVFAKKSRTAYAHFDSSRSETSWKWTSEYSHGSRHAYDDFEYSLWDVNAHDYRRPSNAEQEEILQKYNAQSIRYQWLFVIVSALNPPKDMPLTIGGATACFTPPPKFWMGLGLRRTECLLDGGFPTPRSPSRFPHATSWSRKD